jgi:uncharacterized protein (UPF0548 family)
MGTRALLLVAAVLLSALLAGPPVTADNNLPARVLYLEEEVVSHGFQIEELEVRVARLERRLARFCGNVVRPGERCIRPGGFWGPR